MWNRQHVAKRPNDAIRRGAENAAHTRAVEVFDGVVAHIQPQPKRGRIERLRTKRQTLYGMLFWFLDEMHAAGRPFGEALDVIDEVAQYARQRWDAPDPTPSAAKLKRAA